MQRRSVLLSGTALAFAPALRSQQRLPVVGFLNAASPREYGKPVRAFLRSLEDAGFMEGQSVGVEYRWGDGHYERLDDLAADLVARQVSVIAATSTPANLIAKRHTNTIPIVFTTSSDPLQLGLVQSISRPEANVTGITTLNVELGPKRLDIVEQFLPGVRVIAHLINPSNPNIKETHDFGGAARATGMRVVEVHASTDEEIDRAFVQIASQRAGALVVSTDAFFFGRRARLAELAARFKVPAIYDRRDYAVDGGLIAYGGSVIDAYRLAGTYVARILKGARPAELPVQQATKVELVVNASAARALGLVIPPLLLARADEVID